LAERVEHMVNRAAEQPDRAAADVAYAASLRFIEAMESIELSVTTAKVVIPEGREPAVRVGTITTGDLDTLSRLLEAEAARRAGVRNR